MAKCGVDIWTWVFFCFPPLYILSYEEPSFQLQVVEYHFSVLLAIQFLLYSSTAE